MSLRRVAIGTVFGMLFVAAFVLMAGNATAANSSPVVIDGNVAMEDYAEAHSLPGDGSSGNPYSIQGLTIDAHQAENGISIKNVDYYVNIDNCIVSNTHLATSNIGSGDGIFISHCDHFQLTNNKVNDTNNGITVSASSNVVVYGSTVHNVTYSGIKIAGCTNSQVYRNFCADSFYGISSLLSTNAVKFDNNTCLRGTYGLFFSGSYQNVISDNQARDCIYGISVESGSMYNKIDLNNCSSNSYSGIFLSADGNSVAGNSAYFNGYSGIQVNEADNCVLARNTCVHNPRDVYAVGANHLTMNSNNCSWGSSYGINAFACENITTQGNRVFDNNIAGIYLSSCKNSYLWYDEYSLSGQYGFLAAQCSWIYVTGNSSHNGETGFRIINSNNCTVSSANASNNNEYGVFFDSCHLCRVIDSSIMSNDFYGICSVNSDNSSILRVRAYLNQEGVELSGSDHANISDCHLMGNNYGIWIYNSDRARILNNEISGGSGAGLFLFGALGSDNCTISGNSIHGFAGYGIHIQDSKWTTMRANVLSANDCGIGMTGAERITIDANLFAGDAHGISLTTCNLCMISANDLTGIPNEGIFADDCSGITLELNAFHDCPMNISIQTCDSCLLVANQCDAATLGVEIRDSTGVTVSSGRCTDSSNDGGAIGVYVHGGSGVVIQNVNLTRCSIGLLLEASTADVITNNVFLDNLDTGATLYSCTNVLLHHNLFIHNHGSSSVNTETNNQAYDDNEGMNRWNTSGPDGIGNFWSDWCSPDIDRNGIVDASLFIIGGGEDHLPIADTTVPVVNITSPNHDGVVFTSVSVSLSWDATDTWSGIHHYEVSMDGGEWANVGFGNIQTWGSLIEGQHTLQVKAVDKASNEAMATRMFYVDVSAPEISFTAPGNNTAFTDTAPTIEWTGTDAGPGAIEYSVGWDMGSYSSIGSVEHYTFTSPLANGIHTFNVMTSDDYGHVNNYYIQFYIDTAAPTLDSVSPSDGSTVIVTDVPVSWYAFDLASAPYGLDRTEIKVDSGEWGSVGLASSLTIPGMSEGNHVLYLRTFDKAGNMATATSHFMVDTALPIVSISSPLNHTVYSVNSVAIVWSGSDSGSGIDHFSVSVDSAAMTDVGTATGRTMQDLGEGSHTISVMAHDRSGKIRSAFIVVVIDMTAPMVSITNPTAGGFYPSATINATWTVMEFGSGIASYETKVDDAAWQSRGSCAYASLTLAEGRHTLYVKAIDLAGNSRSASLDFTMDLNPPMINSLTPANGMLVNSTTIIFGWNVSDAIGISSIMYSIDSDIGHSLMNDVSSTTVTLANGNHSFKLTVRDREGREAVGYVNLTVDSVAPTVTTHSAASVANGVSTKLYFGFSELVDVNGMSVKVNGQTAAFVLNGTVYEIGATLVAGNSYLVAVSGAKDVAGNVMGVFSWTSTVVSGQQLPGMVVVSGTMVDKNGQSVPGAVVTIGGQEAITNDQGQFSIYVDPGQLQLQATAVGMVDFSQSVNAGTDVQLGQLAMTSTSDSVSPDGTSSPGGDMTVPLIIGVLTVIVVLVAAAMVMRKRKV